MSHPHPPANIQPFVEALGLDDAIVFLLHFGGAELTISPNPRDGELVKVLGLDGARALADLSARAVLPRRIPVAKSWLAQVFNSRGFSVAQIARRLRVTDVTVRHYLSAQSLSKPEDSSSDGQLHLF